jgi:hypothetical protein
MADIVVAVVCNLVAVLFLVSGIFSAISNGVKVTFVKLFLTAGGGVGAYFLTPVASDKIYAVKGVETALGEIGGGISMGTVNSCLFLAIFMIFYAFSLFVCNVVRHCLIKKLRSKKLNKLKMKRARSINPRAEKMAKKAEWKALKSKYKENRKWYHRFFSGLIGAIIAVAVGFVVLMPYGYFVKDFNYRGNRNYLEKGYEYTLNGVIGSEVADKIIHLETKEETPENEEAPEMEGSESENADGITE